MSRTSKSNLSFFGIIGGLVVLGGLSGLWLTGCGGGPEGYDAYSPDVVIDNVLSFHGAVDQGKANSISDGQGVVYIDFSDGLVNAFKNNQNNVDMIKALATKLVNEGMKLSLIHI